MPPIQGLELVCSAHLEMQCEEWVVREEAVAARRGHQMLGQRWRNLTLRIAYQGRRPMHHFVHVAAYPIEWQIICHLSYSKTLALGNPAELKRAGCEVEDKGMQWCLGSKR